MILQRRTLLHTRSQAVTSTPVSLICYAELKLKMKLAALWTARAPIHRDRRFSMHLLLWRLLRRQNLHFGLGLDSEIDDAYKRFERRWGKPSSTVS
jgi:hypothetical protein